MYKLIIVDDEDIIREGLANLVDWASLGFEVTAQLQDGREAMDYLNSMPVDAILTDIKMTFVSGLDLAQYVYENKPNVKVVLISGYKEFEFARQAISYNVVHYLLKPTRLDEIKRVFNEIRRQLDKEWEERQRLHDKDKQYEELMPLLQEQFFLDIMMGALRNENEIRRRIRLLGLNINPEDCKCCAIAVKMSDYADYLDTRWQYGKDSLYTAIRKFLQGQEERIQYFPLYNMRDTIYALAVSSDYTDDISFKRTVERRFSIVQKSIKELFDLKMTVSIRRIFHSIFDMAVNGEFIASFGANKDVDDINDVDVEAAEGLIEQQKLFMSYINAGNIEAVCSLFDSFMDELDGADIRVVRNFTVDLFAMLSNKLKDMGLDMCFSASGRFSYDDLLKLNDVNAIRKWGRNILNDVIACISRYREISVKKVIQQAKQYMKENYSKDISLEDVANQVFLSPVYFSRLFKEQTGENFIDHLIAIRMEKAMELLRQPQYKIYEVASMVGYKSTKYFSRLFKEYTGLTPSEYRCNLVERKSGIDEQ